jgi:hypothetical protein
VATKGTRSAGRLHLRCPNSGRGYVNDLLAEMTWRLSELAPGEEIRADTEFANVPMADGVRKCGVPDR